MKQTDREKIREEKVQRYFENTRIFAHLMFQTATISKKKEKKKKSYDNPVDIILNPLP